MGTVTDIIQQKKDKDRVNIYVDENFVCGLDALTVVKNHITIGTEIDDDKLIAMQLESEGGKAFERAVKYISIRSRTKKELQIFLHDKGYSQEIIINTIKKLSEYGFCDDLRFCREYISAYKHRNGVNKIRLDLKKLGAESHAIETAIEEIDGQEEAAFVVAERYIRTHSNFDMYKLKTYLYTRGFCGDDISVALDRVEEEYSLFDSADGDFD